MENEKTVSEDRLRSTGVLTVCNSLRLLSFTYGKKTTFFHTSFQPRTLFLLQYSRTDSTDSYHYRFFWVSVYRFFVFDSSVFFNFLCFVRKMKLVYSQFSSARKYTMSYRTLSYGASSRATWNGAKSTRRTCAAPHSIAPPGVPCVTTVSYTHLTLPTTPYV